MLRSFLIEATTAYKSRVWEVSRRTAANSKGWVTMSKQSSMWKQSWDENHFPPTYTCGVNSRKVKQFILKVPLQTDNTSLLHWNLTFAYKALVLSIFFSKTATWKILADTEEFVMILKRNKFFIPGGWVCFLRTVWKSKGTDDHGKQNLQFFLWRGWGRGLQDSVRCHQHSPWVEPLFSSLLRVSWVLLTHLLVTVMSGEAWRQTNDSFCLAKE